MEVQESASLRTLTTLRVGGAAKYVLTIESPEEVKTALAFARERGLPYVVLGEGSNVLPEDEGYPGVVFLMRIPGIRIEEEDEAVLVTAGAGVSWDALVLACAERSLWGIENLAGIPGTVGAAPVQNIGAYGMELESTFFSAQVFDTTTQTVRTYTRDGSQFGYRDSRYKQEPNLIILEVTLRLAREGSPRVGYADLAKAQERGEDVGSPLSIGEVVRRVRAQKFPDLREFGTAGSFFKNPILSPEQFSALTQAYGAVPSFPNPKGIKVPLAFILDRVLSLRGYRKGPTFLFGNQPLVLVADEGATAHDVDELAREIEMRVREATNISIEREVRMLSAHEGK